MAPETKILVVFYSLYGNTAKLARAIGTGVTEVPGCTAILRRVPETMPQETLKQLEQSAAYQKAREEMKDIPIATLDDLEDVDGIIFGSPSHFGNAAAQLKQLQASLLMLFSPHKDPPCKADTQKSDQSYGAQAYSHRPGASRETRRLPPA